MPRKIRNRRLEGQALEAERRRCARQIARWAIREAVLRALCKWLTDRDEQLRDIRQGMRRLWAFGASPSSELERKEVDRLRKTLVMVEDAMDDEWPMEGAAPIKVQLC